MRAYTLEKLFQKMRSMNGSSDYEFLSANRLFVSDVLTLRDCMKELFKNEITSTNFKNTQDAINMINAWVANQTKNNIKDLLKSGQLTSDTKLVLVM